MNKKLSERVIKRNNGNLLHYASIHESYRPMLESWEKGEEYFNKNLFLSDESFFSGKDAMVISLLADFIWGKEDSDGYIISDSSTMSVAIGLKKEGTLYKFEPN